MPYTRGNTKNIMVGAAALFVSDEDSTTGTLPDPVAAVDGTSLRDTYADDDAWRNVGLTTGGVEVTYAPDFGAVEVDQMLDDAKLFKQKMTVTVATTLSEATLENLLFAWGQGAGTLTNDTAGTETLDILSGELGEEPVERALAFVGNAPRVAADATTNPNAVRERHYYLRRCLQVESSAHALNRAEATTIPVSLRCLPGDDGSYGNIVDRVVDAVPAG